MKQKNQLPIDLQKFFQMINADDVPKLVDFYEKEHTFSFYYKISTMANNEKIQNNALVVGMFFWMFLFGNFAYFYGVNTGVVITSLLISVVVFCMAYLFFTIHYRLKIDKLAKDISAYVPASDFIAAHQKFLSKHILYLGNLPISSSNMRKVLAFGISFGLISHDTQKQSFKYSGLMRQYWIIFERQIYNCGIGETYTDDLYWLSREAQVDDKKIIAPQKLKEIQEFVDVWTKHQPFLISCAPENDFIVLFSNLERLIKNVLTKKH